MDQKSNRIIRIVTFVLLFAVVWTAVLLPGGVGYAGLVADEPVSPPASDVAASSAGNTLYLPLVSNFAPVQLSSRMGFGAILSPISQYPDIETLKAGWYLDWRVTQNPSRPNGMEYAQVVRLHQKLECGDRFNHDREGCPYAQPYDYNVYPTTDKIVAAVQANPGSLWLIGNEMDRRDWFQGGQDEMLPEVYARAYHDLYYLIKNADPTARVAIGGIIQATPIRLQYLTMIWDSYQQQFNETMPVDVWNVHNFILKEDLYDYGASIPPGVNVVQGAIYETDWSHVDMTYFDQQIRAFRQWMKDRGLQNNELIVSEYGVLYSHWACEKWLPNGQCESWKDFKDPAVVQGFMLATFDYFLNTKDCSLGYAADECRLVQSWAWYALDDIGQTAGFNPYAGLFNPDTKAITDTGIKFRDYALAHLDQIAR